MLCSDVIRKIALPFLYCGNHETSSCQTFRVVILTIQPNAQAVPLSMLIKIECSIENYTIFEKKICWVNCFISVAATAVKNIVTTTDQLNRPFVLSCNIQFPPHDAIINRNISIWSTFCALRVGVQYRSQWQLTSRSKHASSSSVLYFIFKWYKSENWTTALRPELCSMCIRLWRQEIQQVEVNVSSSTRRLHVIGLQLLSLVRL